MGFVGETARREDLRPLSSGTESKMRAVGARSGAELESWKLARILRRVMNCQPPPGGEA